MIPIFMQIFSGLLDLFSQVMVNSVPVFSIFCAYIVIFILLRFFLSDANFSGGGGKKEE